MMRATTHEPPWESVREPSLEPPQQPMLPFNLFEESGPAGSTPIHDVTGRCVAAISISAPDFRMNRGVRDGAGKLVVEAAREVFSACVAWNKEEAYDG